MILEKKAFTLIEVLVTLAIFSILAAGAVWFIIGSSRDGAVIWEQLFTQSQGKKTVEHVISYVRKAETSSVGAYTLVTTTPYDLVFYANVDSDSLIEKVEFFINEENILKQTITKPSSTASSNIYENGTSNTVSLADNVTNLADGVPIFLYYNEDYTGSQAELSGNFRLTDVRVIKIQLELEKDPNKSPVPLHIEGSVLIRSTKTN